MTAERRNSRPRLFGYTVIYILAKFIKVRGCISGWVFISKLFKQERSESGDWCRQKCFKTELGRAQIQPCALAA